MRLIDQGEHFRKEIEKAKGFSTDLIDMSKDSIVAQVEQDVTALSD